MIYQTDADRNTAKPNTRQQGMFFLAYSIVLFTLVLLGFGPTFFVRGIFEVEPLHIVLVVHGVICTAWFALLIYQSWLVRNRNLTLHRRVGKLACLIIGLLFLVGIPTAFGLQQRLVDAGAAELESLATPRRWAQVARDVLLFVSFLGLAISGIAFRKRPPTHKRFLILASVVLTTPGLARLSQFELLKSIPEPLGFLGTLALLFLVPMIRDCIVEKHVHPILKWGSPLTFVVVVLLLLMPEML